MEGKNFKDNEKIILEAAIELAKKGEGALFVIGDNVDYELMVKQSLNKFNVVDEGARKILVSIATIDGAVIIDKKGYVVAYGAMIKGSKAFMGYGTRHAAAMSASKSGNTAILTSEEERKVKIFKDGKLILQIDALQKDIEKEIPHVAKFLETVGAGVIGAIGVTALVPTLGIAFLPGVIVFGASYFALRKIVEKLKG